MWHGRNVNSSSIAVLKPTHAHSSAECHRGVDSSREDREVVGNRAGERGWQCGNESRDVGGEKGEGMLVLQRV